MNTLVEKGFGIIIFVMFFIPFTFGIYAHGNAGYEFNNVSNEIAQMIKEDGGYWKGSSAYNFINTGYTSASIEKEAKQIQKEINDAKTQAQRDEANKKLKAHEERVKKSTLKAKGYSIVVERKPSNGAWMNITNSNTASEGKVKSGEHVRIAMDYKASGIMGWEDANFSKKSDFVVYKR